MDLPSPPYGAQNREKYAKGNKVYVWSNRTRCLSCDHAAAKSQAEQWRVGTIDDDKAGSSNHKRYLVTIDGEYFSETVDKERIRWKSDA